MNVESAAKSRSLWRVFVVFTVICVVIGAVAFELYQVYLQNLARNIPVGDINVDQARFLIQYDSTLKIVDVRTPEEYSSGHIKGAINLCLTCALNSSCSPCSVKNFSIQIAYFLSLNDRILVYCKAGSRSAQMKAFLLNNSYINVYNMIGGIDEWMKTGYPITTD